MPILPKYLIVTTAFQLHGPELEDHGFPSVHQNFKEIAESDQCS